MADRYMMATKATHVLGDISRDKPDLAVIWSETATDYIGEWVEIIHSGWRRWRCLDCGKAFNRDDQPSPGQVMDRD